MATLPRQQQMKRDAPEDETSPAAKRARTLKLVLQNNFHDDECFGKDDLSIPQIAECATILREWYRPSRPWIVPTPQHLDIFLLDVFNSWKITNAICRPEDDIPSGLEGKFRSWQPVGFLKMDSRGMSTCLLNIRGSKLIHGS